MSEFERKVWASVHGIVACKPYMAERDIYAASSRDADRFLARDAKLYIVNEAPPWVHAAPWLHERLEFVG